MFAQTRSLYNQHLSSVNAYTAPHEDERSSLARTVFASPNARADVESAPAPATDAAAVDLVGHAVCTQSPFVLFDLLRAG